VRVLGAGATRRFRLLVWNERGQASCSMGVGKCGGFYAVDAPVFFLGGDWRERESST
jgi:hypothetical protein